MNEYINQSIWKILLIIDCKCNYANTLFDHQMHGRSFPDLIGLINSTDFNRLSIIDLKLVIINFRI